MTDKRLRDLDDGKVFLDLSLVLAVVGVSGVLLTLGCCMVWALLVHGRLSW